MIVSEKLKEKIITALNSTKYQNNKDIAQSYNIAKGTVSKWKNGIFNTSFKTTSWLKIRKQLAKYDRSVDTDNFTDPQFNFIRFLYDAKTNEHFEELMYRVSGKRITKEKISVIELDLDSMVLLPNNKVKTDSEKSLTMRPLLGVFKEAIKLWYQDSSSSSNDNIMNLEDELLYHYITQHQKVLQDVVLTVIESGKTEKNGILDLINKTLIMCHSNNTNPIYNFFNPKELESYLQQDEKTDKSKITEAMGQFYKKRIDWIYRLYQTILEINKSRHLCNMHVDGDLINFGIDKLKSQMTTVSIIARELDYQYIDGMLKIPSVKNLDNIDRVTQKSWDLMKFKLCPYILSTKTVRDELVNYLSELEQSIFPQGFRSEEHCNVNPISGELINIVNEALKSSYQDFVQTLNNSQPTAVELKKDKQILVESLTTDISYILKTLIVNTSTDKGNQESIMNEFRRKVYSEIHSRLKSPYFKNIQATKYEEQEKHEFGYSIFPDTETLISNQNLKKLKQSSTLTEESKLLIELYQIKGLNPEDRSKINTVMEMLKIKEAFFKEELDQLLQDAVARLIKKAINYSSIDMDNKINRKDD